MARGRRKGWHERKRKENVGERERKDSVRPGAWVEARTRTTANTAGDERGNGDGKGVGTGTGTRERRNTNRLDVDGGVGVGPDMAEASRLPEVAKEMKCLPAGEATLPSPSSPPTPGSFCRHPSTGTDVPRQDFQSSLLFPGDVARGWRRRRRRPEKGVAAR